MNSPDESTDVRRRTNDDYAHLVPVFSEMASLDRDDPRRESLRERLVTEHLPLAHHIARRFDNRGEQRDDLVQVATLGLINAVDRFDPQRGTDFLAFAVPTIMGEVRRYFRDASWAVRVPRRLKELHLTVSSASSELSQSLGRAPTPSEIAAHVGISKEDVYNGLEASNAYHSASMDEVVSGESDSISLGDTLGQYDSEMEQVDNRESLRPLLRELPERERTILMLRFFGNLTQTQIAERVGISQMHVSRLLARTLEQLRTELLHGA